MDVCGVSKRFDVNKACYRKTPQSHSSSDPMSTQGKDCRTNGPQRSRNKARRGAENEEWELGAEWQVDGRGGSTGRLQSSYNVQGTIAINSNIPTVIETNGQAPTSEACRQRINYDHKA